MSASAAVPQTSRYPKTMIGPNPTVLMVASAGSNIEFGMFGPTGSPTWYDNWRILAHELCGHARLHQTYAGGRGCRSGHDVTIDTENAIGAEHGGAARPLWGPTSGRSVLESGRGPEQGRVLSVQRDSLRGAVSHKVYTEPER